MSRFIQVTKILSSSPPPPNSPPYTNRFNDSDEDVADAGGQTEQPAQPTERTTTITINADMIRYINPRKDNRPGTRITFQRGIGRGFAITEPYDVVSAMLTGELVASEPTAVLTMDSIVAPSIADAEPGDEPAVDEPAVDEPAVDEPAAEEPAAEQSAPRASSSRRRGR